MAARTIGSRLGAALVLTAAFSPSAAEIFSDATVSAGLDFVHFNGMTGDFHVPEEIGSGAALFDYDNDGDLDLYFVQGDRLDADRPISDAWFPPHPSGPPGDRLYRNDLVVERDGTRKLRFTDVTAKAGITPGGYGMGVAAGDYDNDGWTDLYVLNYGPNRMWRNDGDGTFTDVTARSATVDRSWSVSASFVDYDRDGWLDLYVANYLRYELDRSKICTVPSGARDYCGPKSFPDAGDRMFRNRGDGTFEDVTTAYGLHAASGSGLGVIAADFSGSGRPQIFVANDADPNMLWVRQADGSVRNVAMLAGCALNADGAAEGSMGVDAADFDRDGDLDLFMTHMTGETHTLYRNAGDGTFDDVTARFGLGVATIESTGFGTGWLDYDNDGWLDLLVVSGAVQAVDETLRAKDRYPLRQPNQLYRNEDGRRFRDVSASARSTLGVAEVSRGAAFGDVDNDGDTDVVVVNNNGPARLLLNTVGARRHWLGLRAIDPRYDRDAAGAFVGVTVGKTTIWRHVHADGSYASASDPRVLFGLGSATDVARTTVRWPDGLTETWSGPDVDRYHTLLRGSGSPKP